MSDRELSPFEKNSGFIFTHRCDACSLAFSHANAAHVINTFKSHYCSSKWCDGCSEYHTTGVGRAIMFGCFNNPKSDGLGERFDRGLRCATHAEEWLFWEREMGKFTSSVELAPDVFCASLCVSCMVRELEVGE